MGFVKGMITGVLVVAGAVVGAAVIGVIKDEKKEFKSRRPSKSNMPAGKNRL